MNANVSCCEIAPERLSRSRLKQLILRISPRILSMSKYGRFNFGSAYAVNTEPVEVDGELYRLRRELAALKETLADRETALANAALDAQQSRERWQQETEAALLDAEQAWKADEEAR